MSLINSYAYPQEISMFLVINYVKRKSYSSRMREETDAICFLIYTYGMVGIKMNCKLLCYFNDL